MNINCHESQRRTITFLNHDRGSFDPLSWFKMGKRSHVVEFSEELYPPPFLSTFSNDLHGQGHADKKREDGTEWREDLIFLPIHSTFSSFMYSSYHTLHYSIQLNITSCKNSLLIEKRDEWLVMRGRGGWSSRKGREKDCLVISREEGRTNCKWRECRLSIWWIEW